MEIKKYHLEQQKEPKDLLYNLAEEYLPDLIDDNFHNLDLVSQTFVLVLAADGQIKNGGFVQFIDNPTGDQFHETIEAAKRIGSKILIYLLTEAANQFPDGIIPKDGEARRSLYDELCQKYISYKTFDELSPEEKQNIVEYRKKYQDNTPIDHFRYEQKSHWSNKWEELSDLYYKNSDSIYRNMIEYLKNNALITE